MADDQAKILEDAKKLPYEARVAHKSWFVKAAAFEDIGNECKKALDSNATIFHDTGTFFVKGVGDANPNVVDKALDALALYLESCSEPAASRIAGPTCTAVASKTLKGRPGTVKKASDVMLAFLEWEKIEEVMEPLFKAFKDKVPKVVIASVEIVSQAFSGFGPTVVKPQLIAKALPSLFDAKQEAVREGVKKIAVEMQAYLGREYVQGCLCEKMSSTMRKDVEKLLEDNSSFKLVPSRFTKKEQEARAERENSQQGNDLASPSSSKDQNGAQSPGKASQDAENMAYEYAEPAEILSSLNKDFWNGLAAKKWTERRDSLLKLKTLASQPRLQPGDYGDVLRELKKIIQKDSMVVIVGEAILCVGTLSKSLRTNFSSAAKQFVSVILEKYKDPKTSVGTAVTECLSNIHKYSLTVSDSSEDFCAALENKNPKVKTDTAKLLQACVRQVEKKEALKLNSTLLPVVSKSANDPTPDVREASMGVIVALSERSGNKALLEKVSADWDETRKKRLFELAGTNDAKPVGNGISLQIPSKSAQTSPKVSPRLTSRVPTSRSVSSGPSSKPALKKPPSKKAPGANSSNEASIVQNDDDDSALAGGTLSESEAKEKMQNLLGDEIFKGLQDGQWKARLEAVQNTLQFVQDQQDLPADSVNSLVQAISYVPGWSEKNFQVLGKAFEVIGHLVSTGLVTKKAAFISMSGLVDKMSDIKLKGPASETLFSIAENISPQFVFTQLHKKAMAHKNPKVLSESILWMSRAVEDFTLAAFNVGQLIEWAKGDLASTNAGVRNASMQLMAVCHRQLGPGLASMIRSDVKPALMTTLEDTFKKNPQTQVVPTRKLRTVKPKSSSVPLANGGGHGQSEDGEPSDFDPDALLPRTDISSELGSKVIASLGSTNWKERNATMDTIENTVKSAVRIQPNVGDLVPALKARLTDSNKNLVARALVVFGELAKAMGHSWEKVGRPVLQQCVTFVADNKKQVRDAAIGMLDNWVLSVTPDKVIPSLVDFLASPKASNEGKVTGLRWLQNLVEERKAQKCVDGILKAVGTGLGDKSAETREASSKLGLALSQVYPQESRESLGSLPGSIQKAVKDLLDRQPDAAQLNLHTSKIPPQTSPRPAPSGNTGGRTSRSLKSSPSKLSSIPTRKENSSQPQISVDSPCLSFSSKKADRCQKARFKGTKFEPPNPSDVETLNEEFLPLASETLMSALFAKDFKKHIEACDLLLTQLPGLTREIMSCMDLLLQWIVVRMCEANTQCLIKILDVLKALFSLMADQGYEMTDAEANTILPCLIEKSGHNQDRLRTYNRELIQSARRLVAVQRIVEGLVQGLTSKNTRTKVDCIDILGTVIEEEGLSLCNQSRSKPIALISQMVSDRDKATRGAVLSVLEGILKREGEQEVWKQAGRLSDQQRSLIEERFKFVYKAEAKQDQSSSQSPSPRSLKSSRRESQNGQTEITPPSHQIPRQEVGVEKKKPVDGRIMPAPAYIPPPPTREVPATPAPALPPQIPGMSSIPTPMPGKMNPSHTSPSPSELVQMDAKDDNEVHDTFDSALEMTAERDPHRCVEGAKRMCYILQSAAQEDTSPEFRMFLARNVTELLNIVTTQLDYIFDQTVEEALETNQPANPRGCKYFVNCTMMIFDIPEMVKAIPVSELRELLFVLLARLLDQDVQATLGETQILRAINVLMMNILKFKFGNDVFEALIQLLTVSPEILAERKIGPQEFAGLLTKCLIRTTQMMQQKPEEIDMHQLLMVIHHYFMSLGVDEIRRMGSQDEKSLRMVKTLLHEICKLKGDEVRVMAQDIPHGPQAMIHVYIDLHLKTLHETGFFDSEENQAMNYADTNGQAHSAQHSIPTKPTLVSNHPEKVPTASAIITARSRELKPSSKHSLMRSSDSGKNLVAQTSWKSVLVPILQRVGASETSEEGLEELRNFMIEHPEVDKQQFFSRLSPEFCAFVDKGLNRLERRHRAERSGSEHMSISSQDSSNNPGTYIENQAQVLGTRIAKVMISSEPPREKENTPASLDVANFRERLRMLQR